MLSKLEKNSQGKPHYYRQTKDKNKRKIFYLFLEKNGNRWEGFGIMRALISPSKSEQHMAARTAFRLL